MNEEWTTIGKILSPYGVRGYVKVYPYSDFPERCRCLKQVTLFRDGRRRVMEVESASVHGRLWLIKLAGIESPEEAAALRGSLLLIPAAERLPLPPGSYYLDQIVGLKVVAADGSLLGEVRDIIATGGHDLYLVRIPGQGVPPARVKQFVREVNLEEKTMVVGAARRLGLVSLLADNKDSIAKVSRFARRKAKDCS